MPTRPIELSNLRILAAATVVTVTVVAWGVLVFTAIEFGRTAREGSRSDWIYLVLATVGAVACMFGAIVMAARLQAMMRVAQRSSTRPLALPLEPLPRPDAIRPDVSRSDAARPEVARADQPRAQVLQSRFTAANVARAPGGGPTPQPVGNGGADSRRAVAGKRATRGYRG